MRGDSETCGYGSEQGRNLSPLRYGVPGFLMDCSALSMHAANASPSGMQIFRALACSLIVVQAPSIGQIAKTKLNRFIAVVIVMGSPFLATPV